MQESLDILYEIEIDKNELFSSDAANALVNACQRNSDFEILNKRYIYDKNITINDEVIIIDCVCAAIGTRNSVGIRSREKLAIFYSHKNNIYPYRVCALREDFPLTIHQMMPGYYRLRELCIFFEPWETCERHWTPSFFLRAISSWLINASKSTLHGDDLPPENIFFQSFRTIYIENDFYEKSLGNNINFNILKVNNLSEYKEIYLLLGRDEADKNPITTNIDLNVLTVNLKKIIHRNTLVCPRTLDGLNSVMQESGVGNFIAELALEIDKRLEQIKEIHFSNDDKDSFTLLICNIPVQKNEEDTPVINTIGFFIKGGIKSLAIKMNVATIVPHLGQYARVGLDIGHSCENLTGGIRFDNIEIEPVTIKQLYDKDDARKHSGIEAQNYPKQAVLAGVGSLGSSLANIWEKEGWGNWVYIDHDNIEAHNIARHSANFFEIGRSKSEMVADSSWSNYLSDNIGYIYAKINDFSNEEVDFSVSNADLIVDATTSLAAPRDLSMRDVIGRCVSTFLTPSGNSSVMLFEDTKRNIRLNHLENQYYRFLLNEDFGKNHLEKHSGELWVGAGCREISTIMPYDIINMHSGILAKQVREHFLRSDAIIKIFTYHEDGAITVNSKIPAASIADCNNQWKIIYDDEVARKMQTMRANALPNETGGILIGYFDQKSKYVYVVDALPPPIDSISSESGFVRGVDKLKETIKEVERRTAYVVTYIGEWHSHPPQCSSQPSCLDKKLLKYLAKQMGIDGLPVLMCIVGEDDINILVKKEDNGNE